MEEFSLEFILGAFQTLHFVVFTPAIGEPHSEVTEPVGDMYPIHIQGHLDLTIPLDHPITGVYRFLHHIKVGRIVGF